MKYNKEQTPDEVWKDIPGYEGLYQVSNLGRVMALSRFHKNSKVGKGYVTKEKVLSQSNNGNGYITVRINGKHKYVHRLVAQAFIPNPFDFAEINHKDENRSNNNCDNLEWCSHQYNANYGTKIERTKLTKKLNNSDEQTIKKRNINKSYGAEKPVYRIDSENNKIWYKSLQEASRLNSLSVSHICCCCKKRRNYHGKFKWEYA